MRALTPLLMKNGVDAAFCGHDEMYEHSVIDGQEELPDGPKRPHKVHFFDVGIAGDGLRGPAEPAEPGGAAWPYVGGLAVVVACGAVLLAIRRAGRRRPTSTACPVSAR